MIKLKKIILAITYGVIAFLAFDLLPKNFKKEYQEFNKNE